MENKLFMLTSLCLFGLFLFSLLFGLFLSSLLLLLLLLFLCRSCLGVLALPREKLLPDLGRTRIEEERLRRKTLVKDFENFSFGKKLLTKCKRCFLWSSCYQFLLKLFILHWLLDSLLFVFTFLIFLFTLGKLRCLSVKQAPELFAAPRRPEKTNVRHTYWEIWQDKC